MSPDTVDQRRERSRRTREALVTTALGLFETVGFDETTVDDIADAAGVSPRTFFHHFGTKETVLFAGYAERLADARARFSPDVTLADALSQAAVSVVEAIADQPDLFLRRARLQRQVPSLRATMLRINEEWIDQMTELVAARVGCDRGDPGARLVAAVANSAMRVAIDAWVASDGGADLAALADQAHDIVRPTIDAYEDRHRSRSRRAS